MHPSIQARLHPGWVIRPWQDNLESPISPTNVFRLWEGTENPHKQEQNLQTPHRKETVLIFVTVCYVSLANDVLKQKQMSTLCGATERERNQIKSTQMYLKILFQTAWHAHCPCVVCWCVLLTWIQQGAKSTFSTSSSAALQETGSISPPAREKNNSHDIIQHRTLKTWLIYVFSRKGLSKSSVVPFVNDELWFVFNI